jgi:hypothetical protein
MSATVQFYDSDGATQLTNFDFGDIFDGRSGRPKKFGVKSTSDRILSAVQQVIQAITGNDGSTMVFHAADVITLSPPYSVVAALTGAGAGGVWTSLGTKGFKITWLSALGESLGSDEVTINVDVATKKVILTWNAPPALATGAKVYRTDTPGTYTSPALRITLGITNTFTDDGSALSAGAPPTVNTSAGFNLLAVLSAPAAGGVWAGTGNYFWRVVGYDINGIELANTFEATVNVDNVTKTVALSWVTITGAATIKVFRSTVSGTYIAALVTILSGAATGYTDLGTVTTPGDLTTSPTYGVPPTISLNTAIAEGNVAIGQWYFFWVQIVVPTSTPEVGNPRLALEAAQET